MNRFSLARVSLALSVFLLVPVGAVFARSGQGTVVRYYLGNDPARWRAETGERLGSGNAAAASPSVTMGTYRSEQACVHVTR